MPFLTWLLPHFIYVLVFTLFTVNPHILIYWQKKKKIITHITIILIHYWKPNYNNLTIKMNMTFLKSCQFTSTNPPILSNQPGIFWQTEAISHAGSRLQPEAATLPNKVQRGQNETLTTTGRSWSESSECSWVSGRNNTNCRHPICPGCHSAVAGACELLDLILEGVWGLLLC